MPYLRKVCIIYDVENKALAMAEVTIIVEQSSLIWCEYHGHVFKYVYTFFAKATQALVWLLNLYTEKAESSSKQLSKLLSYIADGIA